jgi:hypothetical protein
MLHHQQSCRIRNTALTPLVGTLSTHHSIHTQPTRILSHPTLDHRPQSCRTYLSSRRFTNHTWARLSTVELTQQPAARKQLRHQTNNQLTRVKHTLPPTSYRVSQQAQRPDAKLVSNSTSRGKGNGQWNRILKRDTGILMQYSHHKTQWSRGLTKVIP